MSCWDLDLPPESTREQLRRADSGRYSLVLIDSDPDDFEEVCTCVACAVESTATLAGRAGWLVLNRRNGTTLALCSVCAETSTPARRPRRD